MKKLKSKLRSGVLSSPYGFVTVSVDGQTTYSIRVLNGHPIVRGRLKGVSAPHELPEHWIKTKPDDYL